jgi:hypothetical protein
MLTIILLRYILPVVAVVALLVGAYTKGEGDGHAAGYTDGYKIAWNAQQLAINKMVTAQNLENTTQNLKISGFEFGSMVAQAQVTKEVAQAKAARTTIIKRYIAANPTSAKACGWTPQTATAINQIIQAGAAQ